MIFCPNCGEKIRDLETELAKKKKENIKEVDILVQIILTFIPFVNTLAAIRIGKLRIFIAKASLAIFISSFITLGLGLLLGGHVITQNVSYIIGPIIWWLVSALILVYYITKWSRAFNELQSLLERLDLLQDI
jgi:membrane protein DedA with SNARE-associated domain